MWRNDNRHTLLVWLLLHLILAKRPRSDAGVIVKWGSCFENQFPQMVKHTISLWLSPVLAIDPQEMKTYV